MSNEDRLSDLPDCVLLHILSMLDSKHRVRTGILSKRWKHLWKHIPTKIFSQGFYYWLSHSEQYFQNLRT
ncbi:F-box/FBD-like domain protein [Medicago truncatula]|uniref:F-box/FBD-like domain protein n=1 Tax=Medicago truncatula TaxID=3880 RepID=G7JH66_MEDTR|nr:F-box/FBD-like domain protein [Medicago truncatula]AES90492.1 F-box/FBD-like domain protein [Medicago truncatula]